MRNPFRRQPKPTPEWGDHISTRVIAFDFNSPAEDPSSKERSDTAEGGAVGWESALKAEMRRMIDSHTIKDKEEYDECPLCLIDQKRYRQNLRLSRIGRTLAMVNRENRNLRVALERAMTVIGVNMAESTTLTSSTGRTDEFAADIRFIHGHVPEAKSWTNAAYDRAARAMGDPPTIDSRKIFIGYRADCRICNPSLPAPADYLFKE